MIVMSIALLVIVLAGLGVPAVLLVRYRRTHRPRERVESAEGPVVGVSDGLSHADYPGTTGIADRAQLWLDQEWNRRFRSALNDAPDSMET